MASTSITKLLKDSKEDISNVQMISIKTSAETWGAKNIGKLPNDGECKYITLKDLKDIGMIDNKVIDAKTNKEISDELKIKITGRLSKYNVLITEYEVNPNNIDGCEYAFNYKDETGVKVEIVDGLTPVTYNGTNWIVADITKKWYDYETQEWANAVILETGITKNIGDTVDVSSEAKGMFVYIPRYEYKIEGQYGTHTDGTVGTQELPGEIKVNFIEKSKTTSSNGYIKHPAFTFGSDELNGIWVGKFETSHITLSSSPTINNLGCSNESCSSADGLRILPNKTALRYNSVSNFFYVARSMTRSGNGFGLNTSIDTHMMKNSEWGAVAYLSHSKYGKYGNTNYSGVEKQVRVNNCSTFITGIGADSQNEGSSSSTCTTNTYETANGQAASTTGNITGVYDMSGCAYEYVMGYLSGVSSTWGATSSGNVAGFTSIPNIKYYDTYTSTDTTSYKSSLSATACNGGICYGHALSETGFWYMDYGLFIYSNHPWLKRGGNYNSNTGAGVFNFSYYEGSSHGDASLRVVIS